MDRSDLEKLAREWLKANICQEDVSPLTDLLVSVRDQTLEEAGDVVQKRFESFDEVEALDERPLNVQIVARIRALKSTKGGG